MQPLKLADCGPTHNARTTIHLRWWEQEDRHRKEQGEFPFQSTISKSETGNNSYSWSGRRMTTLRVLVMRSISQPQGTMNVMNVKKNQRTTTFSETFPSLLLSDVQPPSTNPLTTPTSEWTNVNISRIFLQSSLAESRGPHNLSMAKLACPKCRRTFSRVDERHHTNSARAHITNPSSFLEAVKGNVCQRKTTRSTAEFNTPAKVFCWGRE